MKSQPSIALLPAALLALALPSSALAFTELARGALTLTTTSTLSYDSNILGNSSATHDTLFVLSPTLNYRRAAGQGSINASLGGALNRYSDHSSLDSEDYFGSLRIGLPTPEGARQSGAFTAGYSDSSTLDEDLGSRIHSKSWNTSLSGTYRLGSRTDLRANLNYSDSNRDSQGSSSSAPADPTATPAADTTTWNAGVGFDYTDFLGGFGLEGDYRFTDTQSSDVGTTANTSLDQNSHHLSSGLFYKFLNGLRASANVGYRWIDRGSTETSSGSTANDGMTFSLRLDGPFLPASRFPKLKSSFSLGYEKGESLGLEDDGAATVVGNLSLAWQARERTSFTFDATRKQGLSSNNFSTVTSSLALGAKQSIGSQLSLSAKLSEEWTDYRGQDRNDTRTRASLNLAYIINREWQTGGGYAYTLSDSTSARHDYDRHLLNAYLSCTF